MNNVIKFTAVLALTSSLSYSSDTPFKSYAPDTPSQVVSPNQLANGDNYSSSQKQRVIFQDGSDQQPHLEQKTGSLTIRSGVSPLDTMVIAFKYPVLTHLKLNSGKIKYTSSCLVLTDGFSSYVTYPFYTSDGFVWAKGISTTQNIRQATIGELSIIQYDIEAGLGFMIATGAPLPILDKAFIEKSAGALSQAEQRTQDIILPLFTLSTQSTTETNELILRSAFISTRYNIPNDTQFNSLDLQTSPEVVDHYFSFAVYNTHTRTVYLNGLMNSVADITSTPSTIWDNIPGSRWVNAALSLVGLS